ncbi:MAG: hypothetical protein JXX14_22765, partial [Deltaproteobacteria bacterium]|nr:hypothetical protein [Deltaproteobacteria bacterium]
MPCRIRECHNTWVWSGEDQVHWMRDNRTGDPQRMCASCFVKYNEFEDMQVPCAREDCSNTWTWTKAARLGAAKRGKTDPPPGRLCDACANEAKNIESREVPCRVRGCTNTWTMAGQEILAS